MDLTLALGWRSVAELKANMLESEFRAWEIYASRRPLPSRLMEIGLAQVARAMAGGKIGDYLLFEKQKDDLEALKEEIGFSPLK